MSKVAERMLPFTFLDELVLRTPALPFQRMKEEDKAVSLINNGGFMEAVYLASPVLYAECLRMKEGKITDEKEIKKIHTSLLKYYQRMYSRCTPFGLFSGCMLVKWSNEDSSVVIAADTWLRSTRLDMHYLCALGQRLSSLQVIKERLRYFPNNSAYQMGEEVRFIEYRYHAEKRLHQISSVQHSDYLDAVLQQASAGITISEIAALLVQEAGVSTEEAVEFADELIASQVLISEMDPAITGDEFIHQLLAVLRRINQPAVPEIVAIIQRLEALVHSLKEADEHFHNTGDSYISLIDKIKELETPFEENKLFQVDMYSRPVQHTVNKEWQQPLLKAIELLTKLFPAAANENLTSFADRFRKRYEDQQVPLLQVLDAEAGIGYPEQAGDNHSPILENLVLPSTANREQYDIKWNKQEQWLFEQLLKAGDKREVTIDEKDLAGLMADANRFPPSLSVMFSMADDSRIVFKGCSGSSAANLLGRFAHADENISLLVKKITEQEQSQNPDIIFAEIVHLPEDRVGNILLHPAFRDYEIPFLAQSSLPQAQQVLLQDILVSVQQDKQIRLFSKKLNKEIIPRLSNAHNFSFRSLPVYYFLADMQTQGLAGNFAFHWGSMARHFRYLPGVRYGDVILFEPTWQMRKEDFAALAAGNETMDAFQQRWKLPALFLLADGDNELLVDPANPESVHTFISMLKGRELIILKEFFAPSPQAVKDEKGNLYNNQFVATLVNEQKVYPGINSSAADSETASSAGRTFLPGSEWLYYKVYCGTKTADELLLNAVLPVTEELLRTGLIDKWFFIRFNDPDFHLRLRFHVSAKESTGKVMDLFLASIHTMVADGLVWRVQLDTYQREIERYGEKLTALAEDLFFTDSKMKLQFLLLTEGDEREKYRWLWAVRCMDELLDAFGYPLSSKYSLMEEVKELFAGEFRADKSLYRQLNQRYNDNRQQLMLIMESPASDENELKPLISIFETYKNEQRKAAQQIMTAGMFTVDQQPLNQLLGSYIHMSLNRLFLSNPRLHELVVYDMLCTYYRSLLKRKQ